MYVKLHTFFLPPNHWSEPWSLTGKEAHHLTKVLRITSGHKIRLIDGAGKSGIFTVEKVSKNEVSLLCNEVFTWPEPESKVHLALAWNKSFRRSWLLEKAVELGVWKIVLWQARHSQGRTRDASQDNWQGKMIAAAKQCENPWLPELIFLHNGAEELTLYSRDIQSKLLLWEEEKHNRIMEHFQSHDPQEKVVVIGPEGGLDREEVDLFVDSGFVPLSLGPRVLRWETAALAPLFLNMLTV